MLSYGYAPASGPLQILADSVDATRPRWRSMLAVVIPVLAVVQVLAVVAHSFGDGTVVNGQWVPDETTLRWTVPRLTIASSTGGTLTAGAPVLAMVGWWVALSVCLALLAGTARRGPVGPGSAWRLAFRRSPHVLGLGLLTLAAIWFVLFVMSVAVVNVSRSLGLVVAFVVAALGAVVIARLALALCVVTVERLGVGAALRRAVTLTRGRTRVVATTVLVGVLALRAAAIAVVTAVANAAAAAWSPDAWAGMAVEAAAVGLLSNLVSFVVIPLQASVLMCTYFWARADLAGQDGAGAGDDLVFAADSLPTRERGWRVAAALAVVALVPSVLTTGFVLTNPSQAAVISVSEPQGWQLSDLLASGTLSDGAVVLADSMQVVRCVDERCTDSVVYSMPCLDGTSPRPQSEGATSCHIEAPLQAAALRPDGTLVALRRPDGDTLRLLWCRLRPSRDCEWGGASTIYQKPTAAGTTALATTPGGGAVVGIIAATDTPGTGQVLLLWCEQLPCAQPQVTHVADIRVPQNSSSAPQLALAVDRFSGRVAVGFRDGVSDDVWLGGCARAGCQNLEVHAVGRWPVASFPSDPRPGELVLASTPDGPVAIIPEINTTSGTVIVCSDIACAGHHDVSVAAPPGHAQLATNGAGDVYVVTQTTESAGSDLVLMTLPRDPHAPTVTTPMGRHRADELAAAVIDDAGRPKFVIATTAGLVFITCADVGCRG